MIASQKKKQLERKQKVVKTILLDLWQVSRKLHAQCDLKWEYQI